MWQNRPGRDGEVHKVVRHEGTRHAGRSIVHGRVVHEAIA